MDEHAHEQEQDHENELEVYHNIDPFLMQNNHLQHPDLHPVHQPEPSRHFGAILDAIGVAATEPLPAHAISPQSTSDVALVSMFESPEWSTSRQLQRTQKRKRTDSDTGDAYSKLRKTIHDRVLRTDVAARNVTTITAFHAAAAQKSYGQEKRFLCPPPLVRITGPLVPHLRTQTLKMSVLSEMGATLQESTAQYDMEHGLVCFKQLHISSQGKDKQFQLVLTLTDTAANANTNGNDNASTADSTNGPGGGEIRVTDETGGQSKRPWASFSSLPVHIISKPSKKTTRGNTPGVSNLGSVALFNRINSQTVRTKYLSSTDDGFTTSSSHWAPFEIEVIGAESAQAPVVYGSRIALKGANGFRSHEYVIRKVEKHKSLAVDAGRQVSQMQKIALMRADLPPTQDGKVTYLSALVERSSVEIAVLPGSTNSTSWQQCEIKTQTGDDGNPVEYHEVNDYATWMITSIGKFECSFFDASGTNGVPPASTIVNPVPAVTGPIRYKAPEPKLPEHSLEMSVSDFFYTSPVGSREQMEIMLGDIGPLKVNYFDTPLHHMNSTHVHSSSSSNNSQPIIHHVDPPSTTGNGNTDVNGGGYGYVSDRSQLNPTILPAFPAHNLHGVSGTNLREPSLTTFLVVFLPSMQAIMRALIESVRNNDTRMNGGGRSNSGANTNTADSDLGLLSYTTNGVKEDHSPEAPPSSIFGDSTQSNDGLEWDDDLWRRDPSLPLLFVRGSDGIGFHSGWVLKCAPIVPPGTALPDPNRWNAMHDMRRWTVYMEKLPTPVQPFDGGIFED